MKTKRLLVIDDDLSIRRTLNRTLANFGFPTHTVGCIEGALSLYHHMMPHIILMDLTLPGLHGVQAVHLFKKISPHIKIFVMSGDVEKKQQTELIQAGAQAVFQKPLELNSLIQELKAA